MVRGGDGHELVEQLRELAGRNDCERVVFMGDLFHVWVADRRFETAEVALTLPAIRELRARRQARVLRSRVIATSSSWDRSTKMLSTRWAPRHVSRLAVAAIWPFTGTGSTTATGAISSGDGSRRVVRRESSADLLPAALSRSFMYGTESRFVEDQLQAQEPDPRRGDPELCRASTRRERRLFCS